jgi:hypothetical protein
MGEVTHLPVDSEGGAALGILMFVATVAYPESHAKRDKLINAARAMLVQQYKRARRRCAPSAPRAAGGD